MKEKVTVVKIFLRSSSIEARASRNHFFFVSGLSRILA